MLYGTAEQDPQAEMVAQLAQEMYHQNMLYMLVENLNKIDFEVRHSSFVVRNRILTITVIVLSVFKSHFCFFVRSFFACVFFLCFLCSFFGSNVFFFF